MGGVGASCLNDADWPLTRQPRNFRYPKIAGPAMSIACPKEANYQPNSLKYRDEWKGSRTLCLEEERIPLLAGLPPTEVALLADMIPVQVRGPG